MLVCESAHHDNVVSDQQVMRAHFFDCAAATQLDELKLSASTTGLGLQAVFHLAVQAVCEVSDSLLFAYAVPTLPRPTNGSFAT